MKRIVCWLLGHRWWECIFADWTDRLVAEADQPRERCLGACGRCGQRRGAIACVVCERVAL